MEQEKVRPEDIKVTKGKIEVDCFIVNGVPKEITRYDNPENHITHLDCNVCGKEFKKRFSYQKTCGDCKKKNAPKVGIISFS